MRITTSGLNCHDKGNYKTNCQHPKREIVITIIYLRGRNIIYKKTMSVPFSKKAIHPFIRVNTKWTINAPRNTWNSLTLMNSHKNSECYITKWQGKWNCKLNRQWKSLNELIHSELVYIIKVSKAKMTYSIMLEEIILIWVAGILWGSY